MVVLVIVGSRLTTVTFPVTHDGLYLCLLSGFFLLGLPMRHAVFGSWFIVVAYLLAEYLVGSSRYTVISGALFLGCFAAMGSLGAYIYEYMMRRAYLNERLLEAARKRAERESQSKTRFLATASTICVSHCMQCRYSSSTLTNGSESLRPELRCGVWPIPPTCCKRCSTHCWIYPG